MSKKFSTAGYSQGTQQTFGRCYESHKPLKVGEFLIYGGSCINPIVKDADVYIGFDSGMRHTAMGYPWNQGDEVFFYIQDMGVPGNAEEFQRLVEWTAVQLTANRKVHAGCIGGHGRTGTFFAALVKHMTGNPHAITYVREAYCQKAVESTAQIDFLHKHFGITKVAPTKGHYNAPMTSSYKTTPVPGRTKGKYETFPLKDFPGRIWGGNVQFRASQAI